jgi:hypothetical protein
MKYARIVKNTVAEVFTPPEGFTLIDCFHSTLIAQFVVANDDVEQNWTYIDGVFSPPKIDETNN